MPNNFTSSTFSTTYFDDFDSTDHYHNILFNSGRSLQARELTQLQTIINKDIERFGNLAFTFRFNSFSANNKFLFNKELSTNVSIRKDS